MFTDIVGYTALTQASEKTALELLEEHRRIIRPILKEHGGREIKTVGDSFLVEFGSALEAANCAVEIQKAVGRHNQTASEKRRIQVRIGLHLGDVVYRGGDIYGDAVNIASRIEPLADPGGICLSEQVNNEIYNKISLPIDSIGKHELKNIGRVIEVYKLQLSGEPQIPLGESVDGRCAWCSRPLGTGKIPYEVSGKVVYFDTQDCLVTYRKLKGVYGDIFH
jgi:class 3 adenylate cyclase